MESRRQFVRLHLLIKRLFDLSFALIGLLLLAPVFGAVALAVKIGDGGPVFYRARRVGQGGRIFLLYKFRTMVVDAERTGHGITTRGDSRITPVGRWLRRSKLDELPQLLNVVRGDMSLVGPRPEDPRYVTFYTPQQHRVLAVRPGITSAATLTYWDEEQMLAGPNWEDLYRREVMPAKLVIDLDYLARWSFWADIRLLLRTVGLVFEIGYTRPGSLTDLLLKLRNRHFLASDTLVFLLIPMLALALRLDGVINFPYYGPSLALVTAIFLAIKVVIFYCTGLYNRYWRYASIDELGQIIGVGLLAGVAETAVFFFGLRHFHLIVPDFPRAVPVIDTIVSLLAVGGMRYSMRLAERLQERRTGSCGSARVLVVGAGAAGVMVVEALQSNRDLNLQPVGFIDDDPDKQRIHIRGVPVLGTRAHLLDQVQIMGTRQVIIAMPGAPGKIIREIVRVCEEAAVHTKIVPGLEAILGGLAGPGQLRDVEIEDLLRREAVQIDEVAVGTLLAGKRVLVTGAGGSIGGEICRQVLRQWPAELVLLGHGEATLFAMQRDLEGILREQAAAARGRSLPVLRVVIADIRFAERVAAIFGATRPEVVFHAAAHRHVPLLEANPAEAVTTNILGTRILLEAALAAGVDCFVLISTDKAVNPTSIMGASKRVAELLVQQAAGAGGRPYIAVRFGNILGSRGSVVETFKQQIAAGGPVTVTHPDMTRYFMTLAEAGHLILQAAALATAGDTFTLDMGEPVRIVDLARDLITLSGLEVGRDIDIVFCGMRPDEKLAEDLLVPGERSQPTAHPRIFALAPAGRAVPGDLAAGVDRLVRAAWQDNAPAIICGLQEIVPEFQAGHPPADGDLPLEWTPAPLTPAHASRGDSWPIAQRLGA